MSKLQDEIFMLNESKGLLAYNEGRLLRAAKRSEKKDNELSIRLIEITIKQLKHEVFLGEEMVSIYKARKEGAPFNKEMFSTYGEQQ